MHMPRQYSLSPQFNFANYSKGHHSMPPLSYRSPNISNSYSAPNGEFPSQIYQPDLHMTQLTGSPTSFSSHHSTKTSSPAVYSGTTSYNTSTNYTLVNSQFSSVISEMENPSDSDTGFNSAFYENPGSIQFRYSETDSLYADSSRLSSYPDSKSGITAQYSNSTDEGVEADMEENYQGHRQSYASSSSSSGVGAPTTAGFESCSSFYVLANQSSFESYKNKIKEVTSSLPSCAAADTCANYITSGKSKKRKTPAACPSSWRRYSPIVLNQPSPGIYQYFRNAMKSPSEFREGRRASDGFVTQHDPKGQNVETCSLKESSSRDAVFNAEYSALTEKSKGFMELHDLPQEHYDFKAFYDTVTVDDDLTTYVSYSSPNTRYENKFKFPATSSPTRSLRQTPYYEMRYTSYDDRDNDRNNVFSDVVGDSMAWKSPTKMHQEWHNVQMSSGVAATSACSPMKQNSIPVGEMSPSRSRRKMFGQLKHKPVSAVLLESSYPDEITTIVEDSANGYKNEELMYRGIPRVFSSTQDSVQRSNCNSNSVPESDFFQF